MLVGQLNLKDVLRSPELRQLDQRVSIRYELRPLTAEEPSAYVAHRLTIAGGGSAVSVRAEGAPGRSSLHRGHSAPDQPLCDRALLPDIPTAAQRVDARRWSVDGAAASARTRRAAAPSRLLPLDARCRTAGRGRSERVRRFTDVTLGLAAARAAAVSRSPDRSLGRAPVTAGRMRTRLATLGYATGPTGHPSRAHPLAFVLAVLARRLWRRVRRWTALKPAAASRRAPDPGPPPAAVSTSRRRPPRRPTPSRRRRTTGRTRRADDPAPPATVPPRRPHPATSLHACPANGVDRVRAQRARASRPGLERRCARRPRRRLGHSASRPSPRLRVAPVRLAAFQAPEEFQLALYYQRAGDFDSALRTIARCWSATSSNPEAHNNLGFCTRARVCSRKR